MQRGNFGILGQKNQNSPRAILVFFTKFAKIQYPEKFFKFFIL